MPAANEARTGCRLHAPHRAPTRAIRKGNEDRRRPEARARPRRVSSRGQPVRVRWDRVGRVGLLIVLRRGRRAVRQAGSRAAVDPGRRRTRSSRSCTGSRARTRSSRAAARLAQRSGDDRARRTGARHGPDRRAPVRDHRPAEPLARAARRGTARDALCAVEFDQVIGLWLDGQRRLAQAEPAERAGARARDRARSCTSCAAGSAARSRPTSSPALRRAGHRLVLRDRDARRAEHARGVGSDDGRRRGVRAVRARGERLRRRPADPRGRAVAARARDPPVPRCRAEPSRHPLLRRLSRTPRIPSDPSDPPPARRITIWSSSIVTSTGRCPAQYSA